MLSRKYSEVQPESMPWLLWWIHIVTIDCTPAEQFGYDWCWQREYYTVYSEFIQGSAEQNRRGDEKYSLIEFLFISSKDEADKKYYDILSEITEQKQFNLQSKTKGQKIS